MSIHNAPPLVFGEAPPNVACRDRNAAYAVIKDANGLVAAIQSSVRGRDLFWLPGGGMHAGEAPPQTIVREAREELGRDVRVRRRLGEAIQFFYAFDKECWYRMTAHFFAAEFQGEADGCGKFELHWVDPAEREREFFHACHVWAATTAVNP